MRNNKSGSKKNALPGNSQSTVWLDKQDVMQQLHISSRTLQTWRSSGLLPFYRIMGKIYYKESDIEALMQKGK